MSTTSNMKLLQNSKGTYSFDLVQFWQVSQGFELAGNDREVHALSKVFHEFLVLLGELNDVFAFNHKCDKL